MKFVDRLVANIDRNLKQAGHPPFDVETAWMVNESAVRFRRPATVPRGRLVRTARFHEVYQTDLNTRPAWVNATIYTLKSGPLLVGLNFGPEDPIDHLKITIDLMVDYQIVVID